jgi:transposase-like protein
MILNALVEKLKRRSKDDFKGRHYEATLILQAVSWYLRYPLSYCDIEELFLKRGLAVDHSTLNRWVLAYAPLIERRLRRFRKPHCGSVRVDETYIKIRGQWRYLYRTIDKHGTPVDFLLTATRDLDAAKRFFRKMLADQPLLAPDRIGTDGAGPYPPAIAAARKDGLLPHDPCRTIPAARSLPHDPCRTIPAARPRPLRQQAPAARDRERSLPGQEAHAVGRRLPILPYGAAHHSGVRSDAVAAPGLWLCGRVDGVRAEPAARSLFRSPAG